MSLPPPAADGSTFHPNTGVIDPNNVKLEQLRQHESGMLRHKASGGGCPFMSLQLGQIVKDDDNILKAGVRGPALLEDQIFREKLNHFDHERIPERVVHARGTGVHGHFQVYESLKDITCAAVFQDPSVKTPTFVRFSTVLGSRGSMDTARDVRGFATKFYTSEGNWDLVGNNIPVFFIQDFWDFCSWTPESLHMLAWAMSDRAIPKSYRMMQGFSVNTYVFVNEAGKRTFFKAHWRPKLGVHGLAWDEALKLGGADPDFHRRDLYENIAKGNFPEYEFGVQLVAEEDENKFPFDILDCTKIIPEELVPIRWVGKMVLDRLPTDFFAEVEQVAFCTQNIVRGIDFSNDPMLQGRNFSYLDTQLFRLGSVNFNQLPINRPLAPANNNQRDGYMQMNIHTDKLNYFPNRFSAIGKSARPGNGGETQADLAAIHEAALETYKERMEGMKVRMKAPKFKEHFEQASLFYNSLEPVEQEHLLKAAIFELSKVDDLGVRQRMVNLWNEMDHEFAKNLAKHIAVPQPKEPKHKNNGQASKFLSMVRSPYSPMDSCATRKVACPVADGFRAEEVRQLKMALEKEGAELVIIGVRKGKIFADGHVPSGEPSEAGVSKDPSTETPDPTCHSVISGFTFWNCKSVLFDAVALVGGPHVERLEQEGNVLAFATEALKHCKAVLACSESVKLLHYPSTIAGLQIAMPKDNNAVVSDQGVVTANSMSSQLCEELINNLKQHRYWNRKNVNKLPA